MRQYQTPEIILKAYEDHKLGLNFTHLSKKYNVGKNYLRYNFRKSGFKMNKTFSSLLGKNEHYFDVVDSEEKAYLLGLLYADGSISKDYCSIAFDIKDSDKYLIDLFHDKLNPNGKLYFDKIRNTWKFHMHSPCMGDVLHKLGMVNNKSHKDFKIPEIPENLKIHFIRGFADGDGWVSVKAVRPTHTTRVFGIISKKELILSEIKTFLESKGITNIKIYFHKTDECYSLMICKQSELTKLYNLCYKDANFSLERKKTNMYLSTLTNTELNDWLTLNRQCNA